MEVSLLNYEIITTVNHGMQFSRMTVLYFAIFGEERSPLLVSGFEFRALYKIINRNCMPVRASPHAQTHTLELHVRISRGHMLQEEKAVITLAGSAPQG